MAKKKKKKAKSKREEEWAKAKRLCRLSREDVRMAKEMGMSPRGLIKNRANKFEPWKVPVRFWIRELYEKRRRKQAKRRARKAERNGAVAVTPVSEKDVDKLSGEMIPF